MRALSLWQPWASLLLHPDEAHRKVYETRSWPCPLSLVGEHLAIHATATLRKEAREIVEADGSKSFESAFAAMGATLETLPLGAVLGIARVTDCLMTERALRFGHVREFDREWELGDFGPGRYAWRTEVVERFEVPIPAKGMQGIWEWAGR